MTDRGKPVVWNVARGWGKASKLREDIEARVREGEHVHSWGPDGEVCESETPGCAVAEGDLPLTGI